MVRSGSSIVLTGPTPAFLAGVDLYVVNDSCVVLTSWLNGGNYRDTIEVTIYAIPVRTPMSVMRRCLALGLASVTGLSVLAFSPAAHAAADPLHDGLSAATAAASCWEIKQNDPRSQNGTY